MTANKNQVGWRFFRYCSEGRVIQISLLLLAMVSTPAVQAQWQAPPDAPDPACAGIGWVQDEQGAIYTAVPDPGYPITSFTLFRWTKCGGWQVIGGVGSSIGAEVGAAAMFAKGSDIYFAGSFDETEQVDQGTVIPTVNITKFNVDTGTWSAVGDNSMAIAVTCLCVDSANKVYVGTGLSSQPGTLNLNEFLVWDGSIWSAVGGGVWDSVLTRYQIGITALATDGTSVYVAGSFDHGQHGPLHTPSLMKWDGSSWKDMGTWPQLQPPVFNYYKNNAGDDPVIRSIAISGNEVWVTGVFTGPCQTCIPTPPPVNLARFDANGGGEILPYTDTDTGPDRTQGGDQLITVGGTVYFAGAFTSVAGQTAYGFAQYANGSWQSISGNGADLLTSDGYEWVPATGAYISADANAVYLVGDIMQAGTVSCDGTIRWLLNDSTEPFSSCDVTLGPGSYSPNGFSFPVYGQPGSGWQAESSTDDVNWQPVRSPFTLWGGSSVFTDSDPFPNQYTFYSVFNNCCQGPVMAFTQVGADASAWWPLDDNATEVAGGLNGTLDGTAGFTTGAIGLGMTTSTKPSGVTVPDAADLDFGVGADFSIDCWIQPQNAITSYGVMEILSKRLVSGGLTEGYELCVANGQVVFQMSSTMNSPLSAGWTGPDLRDGAWHHVAVTVQRSSGSGGIIYVDGSVIATFNPTSQSGSLGTTASLLLGMHPDPNLDCNFRGGIDEAAMYNRVLSATEVQTLHNKGTRPASGLVAWWRLEGDMTDSAGANNGSLAGSLEFASSEVSDGLLLSAKPAGVTVADAPALNFGSGVDFTLETWIQPQQATTSYGVMEMLSKRLVSGGATEGYELCVANGQVVFQMSSTMNSPLSAGWTGPDLRDGAWHHVAVTVQRSSSTGGTIYVDGAVIATFNPTSQSGSLATSAPLLIGEHPDPSLDCNFRGGIDEPTLYAEALTALQIKSIYLAGKTGKYRSMGNNLVLAQQAWEIPSATMQVALLSASPTNGAAAAPIQEVSAPTYATNGVSGQ